MALDPEDRTMPTAGRAAGYLRLIDELDLFVPSPFERHAVADRQTHIKQDRWVVHPSPRWPGDAIVDHLVFALKYEGINLLVLKHVFEALDIDMLTEALRQKPGSGYLRRLAFLYEWLTENKLPVADTATGNYVPVLDERLQYTGKASIRRRRFRILDNFPGTRSFCPLVARTQTLDRYLAKNLSARATDLLKTAPPEVLARAAAYLLLADSKASFEIEKERPTKVRIARWGAAIGRAGLFDLTTAGLIELQREVIGDDRFVRIGLRTEAGFVGNRNLFNEPIPDHISANAEDLPSLIDGLIAFARSSEEKNYDAVFSAAALSFGFVYVHPFEDGNGRLHRFLIHHILAHRSYTPPDIIFPISNAILHDLLRYRTTLETWSKPLLRYIDWSPTERGNVEVENDTGDLYRYFDATPHAEFLFQCLERTIEDDLPRELSFLETRDRFHRRATEIVDMPEQMLDLLFQFLRQNRGRLSRRAREREFVRLMPAEIEAFETLYEELTTSD